MFPSQNPHVVLVYFEIPKLFCSNPQFVDPKWAMKNIPIPSQYTGSSIGIQLIMDNMTILIFKYNQFNPQV